MMRILLTTPPAHDRTELATRLTNDGYQVVTAADGVEAMRVLRNAEPDLAILDRRLDRRSGTAVAGWLKDHVHLHRVPVILLVDPADLAATDALLDCSPADVLVTPVDYRELRLRLEMRANTEARFSGLFAGCEASRSALQENLLQFLRRHRDREEEMLGLFFADPETGLHNRAYFKIRLSEELRRARRYGSAVSVLLLKLASTGVGAPAGTDDFPASAMTLKEIAGILLGESRDLDVIGRYAPGDLAMLLPNTVQDGAVLLARRISEQIISHPFRDDRGGRDFQLRVGIATYPVAQVSKPQQLMARAYDAVENAENFGMRDVCIWEARAEECR